MAREILAKISINTRDFDIIDQRTDELFLPVVAYCNHDGNHTLVMKQKVFRENVVPMFGMGYTLKAAPILRVPDQSDLDVIIVKGKITLERRVDGGE
ncbi:hypothetical protein [Rhizobium sp. MHM7A]|uniref:hypothetical protein n=1 Tax=Rhizobium sp. MHM7A TaxID=2583233 RepID=UPI0011070924|nr:hypothetical protein [Rhizobium sp. MHM7A]TLX16007.1 hypothetical protein FFR93_01430 [Rhizobium sp. MHM7A]